MSDSFTIPTQDPCATVVLSASSVDYIVAEVRHAGLQAAARVGTYLSGGLGDFFTGLAADWRGWTGERQWASLEDELRLRARADRTGHVYLDVRLQDGAPARWSVEASMVLEAGRLEKLASAARAFEQSAMRAA